MTPQPRYTLGQNVYLTRLSDPPVRVRSRVVGITLEPDDSVRYNLQSVRRPELGTLCGVTEDRLSPYDGSANCVPAERPFKVGDVVEGVPGSALFGRGQMIVRRTNRPGSVWPLEVSTADVRDIPASQDELVPVPPSALADGHNPDGLTVGQVGPGYRLTGSDYVGPREFWRKLDRGWDRISNPDSPQDSRYTYRIVW